MIRSTILPFLLSIPFLVGCPSATTPTPPLAPGYQNSDDQLLGQSLAAVNAFRKSEEGNYNCDATAAAANTCLTAAQKASEKTLLNNFIQVVNLANQAYTAYHAGTQTLAQAQAAEQSAESAQTALTAAKGVGK